MMYVSAGWGAFLGQAARQHDFLGEYVGELLSQAEADRRGKAYDRSNNSYLFGVNSAWVLDAREAGNNLRFANHRSQPNCQTRCARFGCMLCSSSMCMWCVVELPPALCS